MSDLADYAHSDAVRQLLLSLVPVLCPPRAIELGLANVIVDHVELTMRASPKGVRLALIAGISGYEVAAMVHPGHIGTRASRLSLDHARRNFEAWYHSKLAPQHELAKGLKSLISLACYEQPAMMKAIGYTPQEWIDKSVRYRLKTYSESIAQRERDVIAADPLPGVIGPEKLS